MDKVRRGDSLKSSRRSALLERFESFVATVELTYNVSLARPRLEEFGDIKRFCSGLLEGQIDHPWRVSLRGLSATSRMSIAHSLFLFRKLIPSEAPQLGPYLEKMSTPQDPADPRFLRFAVSMVNRIFPRGWDRSYLDKVTMSTLPLSACFERGRGGGGCRGLEAQARWDRMDFASYVSESVAPRRRGVSRVTSILTEGKWRIISIPPRVDNALRPLHVSMYDHISRQDWCLRGDAKPSRFGDFTPVEGEVFVSGDYESATDNLNSEVQHTILEAVLNRARSIPPGIRAHALSTFSSLLTAEKYQPGGVYDSVSEQRRGQLMGQLCSFPLLCLTNYITFKWLVRRDVPVRINGDDIVFRGTPQECDVWSRGVGASGLTLSVGKTLVHPRFFSLNSAMFRSGKKPTFVPFIRPKTVWSLKERECEKISSLANRFYSFAVGYGKERREKLARWFLTNNMATIHRCRRSLTRGMGIKVSEGTLRATGLWHRELFYLEHSSEPALPTKSFAEIWSNDTPSGWTRVSPRWYPREVLRGWEYRYSHETVANAWKNDVNADPLAAERWMEWCDQGCSTWGLGSFVNTRMRKLLGLSRKELWRYVCIRRNESVFGRVRFERGKGCVRPDVDCSYNDVDNNSPVAVMEGSFKHCPPPSCLL
ncbi:RNA dependent RNA polymerase [Plasmopara viticola lesion associated ourmia-like virus 14]|uniref:RNA dependent RNA polymerase n=1 Tax=Plasmopara viticola lesion associated ourmia-like virus 14 TaxID=2686481 RepID=A0ABX6FJM0_9VIRU|nr:RNA dependent RNA polymerase [Plasmopara viticola lesion associated ourmia-like virus 14]QGY72544.1 RNA dependent RNA polymerase [Plasmopara viticola lesion associated ourmia-like virus 14]